MADNTEAGEPRRQFTDEFKQQAPSAWCSTKARRVGAVARELDLTASALRQWVKHAAGGSDAGRTGLTTDEREELARLRKENRDPAGRARHPKKMVMRAAAPASG